MSKDDDSVGTKSLPKGLKQRGPPQFRYLPADRAKKLKRQWIEKKKIKSKWKAQKRKQFGTTSLIEGSQESPVHHSSEGGSHHAIENERMTDDESSEENSIASMGVASRTIPQETRTSGKSDVQSSHPRQGNSQRGRGRGQGRGMFPGRGKSRQPDMQSKMVELLAKIQKNYG